MQELQLSFAFVNSTSVFSVALYLAIKSCNNFQLPRRSTFKDADVTIIKIEEGTGNGISINNGCCCIYIPEHKKINDNWQKDMYVVS